MKRSILALRPHDKGDEPVPRVVFIMPIPFHGVSELAENSGMGSMAGRRN